jgi:hypothetical protein
MILVTYEPMEGVSVDVAGPYPLAGSRCSGTHGEMINSDLHGAESPPDGC